MSIYVYISFFLSKIIVLVDCEASWSAKAP